MWSEHVYSVAVYQKWQDIKPAFDEVEGDALFGLRATGHQAWFLYNNQMQKHTKLGEPISLAQVPIPDCLPEGRS